MLIHTKFMSEDASICTRLALWNVAGVVSRDQERVHLSYTNDVRLNIEISIKILQMTDSTNMIEI